MRYVQLLITVFNAMKRILILVQFVRIVTLSKLTVNVVLATLIVLTVKVTKFVLDVNLDGLLWRIILKEFV